MMIPVIIIQGPTSVGKSEIALKLIKYFNSELISADSRQIYKFMNIGTAKPTIDEQNRIKHHFIDIIKPNEIYTAGKFQEKAQKIAKNIFASQRIPFIVGGTGFYVKAFQEGLFKSPEIKQEIRERLREYQKQNGNQKLYQDLLKIDNNAEKFIHPNDTHRILRHLEVFYSTDKLMAQHWKEQKNKIEFDFFNILVSDDRQKIYERINKRYDNMLGKGLLKEIEYLLDNGYQENDPGMKTVGYQELLPYFYKKESLNICVEKAKQHSRNYAKRQLTWYRKCNFNLVLKKESVNLSNVKKQVAFFAGKYY